MYHYWISFFNPEIFFHSVHAQKMPKKNKIILSLAWISCNLFRKTVEQTGVAKNQREIFHES